MKALFSVALSLAAVMSAGAQTEDRKIIRIATDNTDLVLEVGPNKRLYQTYLGPKLLHESDLQNLSWSQHAGSDGSVSTRGWEAYSTSGNEDFFEPALGITHADGNMTTYLYYVDSSQQTVPGGIHTRINLRD
ncbi:MAG: alpha-galactosidase, partial [Muribaculaceae bacterium]|nr:alpha-galactosidase [Muribaculaceae bacterium]